MVVIEGSYKTERRNYHNKYNEFKGRRDWGIQINFEIGSWFLLLILRRIRLVIKITLKIRIRRRKVKVLVNLKVKANYIKRKLALKIRLLLL